MSASTSRGRNGGVAIAQIMQPHEANPLGNIHGGVIMHYIDNAAAVVATRHARGMAVTASVDRLDFYHPVRVGDLLLLKAALNWVGRSSMEIGVRVEAEDLAAGGLRHISSAYLTFVALADNGRPRPVPAYVPEGPEARRRWCEALARREARKREGVLRDACVIPSTDRGDTT